MDLFAHVAVGYLLWSLWARTRYGRPPADLEFWAVLVGSVFPDLVDKPLAWELGLLPAGRSLAHSLLSLAVLFVVLGRVTDRFGHRSLAVAFAVGAVAHSLGDAVAPLLAGEYAYTYYLLWPLVALPPYDTARDLLDAGLSSLAGLFAGHRLPLVAIVFLVWLLDRAPGVGPLRITR